MNFNELCVGDLFNTKSARWVKISDTQSVCVMSGVHEIGSIHEFTHNESTIIPLFTTIPNKTPENVKEIALYAWLGEDELGSGEVSKRTKNESGLY